MWSISRAPSSRSCSSRSSRFSPWPGRGLPASGPARGPLRPSRWRGSRPSPAAAQLGRVWSSTSSARFAGQASSRSRTARGSQTRSSARAARHPAPTSRRSISRRRSPTDSRSSSHASAPPGAAAETGAPAAGSKVSLGIATIEQLDELPGIGPVTAQKIVDWRASNGPFRSVEDLDDVPGIGPARIEQLRELVTP